MLSVAAAAVLLLPPAIALPDATVPDIGVPEIRVEDAAVRDYIVAFHALPEELTAPGATYQGEPVLRVDEPLQFAVVRTHNPAAFEVSARGDDRVRYVEWDNPSYGVVTLVPNDPKYSDAGHYGSKKVGAEKAWDRTLGATSVKVAVIDSGLRKTHEEFAGHARILQGWDFVNNDNNPDDTCGHGTHVTGTIAATINNGKGIAGLAQVSIVPIKGLSSTLFLLCSGSTSVLASSLRFAGDQGAHLSSNSWGGGGSASITDAINYAHGKGVTHVAAAGNDGPCTNCVSEPWKANEAKVIIVASTTSTDVQSSFSSEGSQVDVAAPGSDILSSYNSNDASYTKLSGTSMATPHVTGTLALVKTLNPTFGYAELDDRIKTTAVDLGPAGKDTDFGYGRINADAATAGGAPPPNGAPTANAGPDQTVADGDGSGNQAITLDGRGSSDSDGTIVSYAWREGATTVATGANPTATFAVGSHTITLTVTDDDGATGTDTVVVTVNANAAPTASFTFTTSTLTVNVNGGGSSDSDGSISAYAWSWGDGTPAGSGATAIHTYATAGTYTVTLTVTDNGGATGAQSRSVTVSSGGDPDPSTPTLTNGVAKSDSVQGSGTSKYYKIQVPSGEPSLTVVLDGPACGLLGCNPDLDLYVKRGAKPTDSSYDCRPYEGDNDETCALANPAADWWYVRVKVFSGGNSGAYTVKATY